MRTRQGVGNAIKHASKPACSCNGGQAALGGSSRAAATGGSEQAHEPQWQLVATHRPVPFLGARGPSPFISPLPSPCSEARE